MPRTPFPQEINSSADPETKAQSDELQKWERYSGVISCFEIGAISSRLSIKAIAWNYVTKSLLKCCCCVVFDYQHHLF
ncbi:hypothetical protein WKK05_11310 [Nostoc sp. UHCC 0302]|uniref:hypothetical protein n=1 Tax=Nostoc sp. UHCC 0302 TaxID=3134896 RepID=UPI00311CAE99